MCTIPDIAPRCASCAASSSPTGRCTSSSTASPPTSRAPLAAPPRPLQQRLFGGCHLTRPIVGLLSGGGFAISEIDVYYEKGAPKALGANSLGWRARPET